jgi:hypothetical protein
MTQEVFIEESLREIRRVKALNAELLAACKKALKESRDGVPRVTWATRLEEAISKAEAQK